MSPLQPGTPISHAFLPSTLEVGLDRVEATDGGSSARSSSDCLDVTESIFSHDDVSDITGQTDAPTVDGGDDVPGRPSRDPTLDCDKQGQDLYDYHLHEESFAGLASMSSNILFGVQAFPDGEVVGAASGLAEASNDRDPHAIKLEQSDGPGRRYHQLGTSDGTQGLGLVEATEPQPNEDPISNSVFVPWSSPQQRFSEATKDIRRAQEVGILQGPTGGSSSQDIIDTSLHLTISAPASGRFMAAKSQLMAVIGLTLAGMHQAELVFINMLMATMDEAGLAAIGMLLAAMDEELLAAQFSRTQSESPPTEVYWRPSTSSSSTTRQTRINVFPKAVIQRLMTCSGTIYFGMDMDSFMGGNIHPGVTNYIRRAAIRAAQDFREQNLGVTFAYTTDRSLWVFSIRYDRDLDRRVLAEAFFPSDSPGMWQVRVSSLADNLSVFEDNRRYIRNTLDHEFAHILGLRHYDAGSNPRELDEPSLLWRGTRDGDRNTIMLTGVHPRLLRLSAEDFRVIREFYSEENGAMVDGVRIVDVDPYRRLWDFFMYQARLSHRLNHSRRRLALD